MPTIPFHRLFEQAVDDIAAIAARLDGIRATTGALAVRDLDDLNGPGGLLSRGTDSAAIAMARAQEDVATADAILALAYPVIGSVANFGALLQNTTTAATSFNDAVEEHVWSQMTQARYRTLVTSNRTGQTTTNFLPPAAIPAAFADALRADSRVQAFRDALTASGV